MIKFVTLPLLLFSLFACEPVSTVSQERNLPKPYTFICLTSQNQCEIITDIGQFSILFSGENKEGRLITELPFHIQLTYQGDFELENVTGYLEGKDMFMGKIPVFYQSGENLHNIMIAQSLLASCAEEVMTWRLWFTVKVILEGKILEQQFFIDVDSQRLD